MLLIHVICYKKFKNKVPSVATIGDFDIYNTYHNHGLLSTTLVAPARAILLLAIYAKTVMSRLMRKPTICICENKDADQLRSNREADQRLCFRYMDSTIPLLLKYNISSFESSSVLVQLCLCQTCSETTLLVFPRGGSNANCCSVT